MSKYEITDEQGGIYSSDEPLPPLETLEAWSAAYHEREPGRKQLPDSLLDGTDTSEPAKIFGDEYQRIGSSSYKNHPFVNYMRDDGKQLHDGEMIDCMTASFVRDPQFDDQLSEDLYEAARKLGLVK
ncbi:hypothetical protein ACI2KS_10275 [Pseudomonas sp. NPDC087358]|uniref:hypothetical protein n=1 Tax=Pseudomonas sp. NPDC087358 TaxID=3364439 RepID=UPI00384D4F9B